MATDNLSLVLQKKDVLSLEQREIPEPGSNEVLIRMHSVGICGSDLHFWKNGGIGDFIVKAPMVLGHESSGTVAKLGPGVTNLAVGDRVAIEPGVPCRFCKHCKTGHYNLCKDVVFCATPPDHGTLARYFAHPADFCFKLPDNVSYEEGALLEPLSVAVHACRRAEIQIGQNVLVCGAGPIGLVNLLTAKAMGAEKVIITDVEPKRLAFAQTLGADHTLLIDSNRSASELAKTVEELLGCQPDVTMECSGNALSVQMATLATGAGGRVVLVGFGLPEVTMPIVNACMREVDIRGTWRYANCYPIALSLVASGRVNVKPLVTHRFTLEQSKKAFETAHTQKSEVIKVIIAC